MVYADKNSLQMYVLHLKYLISVVLNNVTLTTKELKHKMAL